MRTKKPSPLRCRETEHAKVDLVKVTRGDEDSENDLASKEDFLWIQQLDEKYKEAL